MAFLKGLRSFLPAVVLIVLLASTFSCKEKRPDGILTRAQMVQVLGEIYITEEKINRLGLHRDSAREVAGIMRSMLLENEAMEDSVFRQSFDYYMERPMEMELIYTALVDSLQLREQRAPYNPNEP